MLAQILTLTAAVASATSILWASSLGTGELVLTIASHMGFATTVVVALHAIRNMFRIRDFGPTRTTWITDEGETVIHFK